MRAGWLSCSRWAQVDRFSCVDVSGERQRLWTLQRNNQRCDGDDRSKDVRELIARRRNRWLRLVVALEPSMWSIFHGWWVNRFWCFFYRREMRCGSCIVSLQTREGWTTKGACHRVSRIFLDTLRKIESSWHLRGTAGQRKEIFLCSKIFILQ